MSKPLLITAFDSFLGAKSNSSEDLLQLLSEDPEITAIANLQIVPNKYFECFNVARTVIDREKPRFVLGLGQAAKRSSLCLERVAINLADDVRADNNNAVLQEQPIIPGGREAYFATLPVTQLINAVTKIGVPMKTSNSAGTFVCNAYFYQLLAYAASLPQPYLTSFLHLPLSPTMETPDTISTKDRAGAVKEIVRTMLQAS